MARPAQPRPTPVLPPGEALDARYAAAQRAAEAAEAEVRQASARHLAGLLRARPEARFAALADGTSVLTQEDRTQLLTSLRGAAAPARAISAVTASRWAIWRSRLPYRVVSLGIWGFTVVAAIGLALLAWRRTPQGYVMLSGRQDLSVSWQLPEGNRVEDVLKPNQRYQLLRWSGEGGRLRLWLPGRGYAEAQVARSDLRSVP